MAEKRTQGHLGRTHVHRGGAEQFNETHHPVQEVSTVPKIRLALEKGEDQ